MKRILKNIVITSLFMIALMAAFLWKMNDLAKDEQDKDQTKLLQEKDLLSETGKKEITTVKEVDIIPLYLSGDQKNVVTFSYKNLNEVYDVSKSQQTEDTITDIKKNKKFSFDEPMWAYNPFGTNPLGLYLYFKSEGNGYLRYTISVKDETIPDFTRTAQNHTASNISKEHEFQIIGLVPGMTNYITLKLYNKEDELAEKAVYKIDIPKERMGAKVHLDIEKGYSKSQLSNGLFTVFTDRLKGSDQKYRGSILFYDNCGVLRAQIPVKHKPGRNIQVVYDTMVIQSDNQEMALVNSLGQVTKVYAINGYTISGEYTYDGSASLYVIATGKYKNPTRSSKILKIEMETGEVSVALDMDSLLEPLYKKAKKLPTKQMQDWITINSVQVTGINQLLVSSKSLSSIFKVSQVNSLLPNVDYIIADKKLWANHKKYKKKVLTKENGEESGEDEKPKDFASQFGQNAMQYTKKGGEGIYLLEMLNNNAGRGAIAGKHSYYYQYQVDETAGTYRLKRKYELDQTVTNGNVMMNEDTVVFCDSDSRIFQEIGRKDDRLVRGFYFPGPLYRVTKADWKNFWFF